MQRILAFLVLLILSWAARGQAVADWYYWFDTDAAPRDSGKVTALQFQLQTDVSHLPTGAHTLYVQVADTAGVFSPPLGKFFFRVPDVSSFDKLFYSIDTEEETHSTDFGNGTFSLDVSSCTVGLHTISLQVADKQGGVSGVMPYLFYKVPMNARLSSFRYWFDNEQTVREQPYGQGQYLLDVSQLTPGLHLVNFYVNDGENNITDVQHVGFMRMPNESNQKLHYWFDGDTITNIVDNYRDGFLVDVSRLKEGFNTIFFQMEDNGMSDICSQDFIKIPQTEGNGDMTVICVIDGRKAAEQALPINGGIIKWDMDVSNIEVGLHKAMFQIITPSGAGSSIAETYFLRTITDAEAGTMQCSYVIDGFRHYTHKGTLTNGAFHFDLPVADIEDGLHRIDYMLVADNGVTTTQGSAWFFKTPVGGNCITQYDYWLNSKSDEMQSVALDTPTDPLKLINLLPVTAEPIRSSCFHFELKDGRPMMFAKNDIHFRFHDKSGRWVDADNQYADYSVNREIEPVGELQATQTFPRVEIDSIRWYTMQAAPGDTAAFRLSQAATLQVFAPSGKEVLKASESASVKWSGIHTWEEGTYYVAVHDVMGSQSNMTLDYMHMDKYDVVEWDVHTVGNGGCSTITFKGNGFRDLYRVELYTAAGDSIRSVDISHDSDAETAVTFDFSGAELSVYGAVFHFTQEDKHFANIVTVEEAVDIELATNVSFPSTFLRGTSTTYTIKITNKGNMTAYCVPLELRLRTTSIQDISEVWFSDNLEHFRIPQEIYIDSIDEDVSETLQEALKDFSDLAQFVFYTDSLENISYGLSQLFLNIRPSTTETFTITIRSSSTVYLEAKATDEWVPLTFRDMAYTKAMRIKRKSAGEWMCCNRTKIECVADVVANVAGTFMPPGANCATSLSVTGLEAIYDILCSEGNTASEKFQKYLNSEGKSLARKLLTSAISCVTGYFDKFIFGPLKAKQKTALDNHDLGAYLKIAQEIRDAQKSLRNIISSLGKGVVYGFVGKDCVEAFTKPIPNCPPCTKGCGGGGSSTPQPPSDPNDIYGYLSEAGSKFIADTVAKVNYTIEFENDTAFAQASAHTIVIRDTLDSRYFDLKSFLPTSVKIGERETFLEETEDVKTVGGVTSFLKTIDMRPEIYAIAQVEGEYSLQTGIATWTFTSLDPMTMEPTDDLMQGILPVNYNGTSGIGEVMFEVGVKPNKGHGTEIKNRASIVFDYEEAILTPIWVNTVDARRPVSRVVDATVLNDSTATVSIDATDDGSGPWRYNVYVQYGSGAWFLAAENVPADTTATVKIYDGIVHHFYCVATDMAGNVEVKEPRSELTLTVSDREKGDVNGDGAIDVADIATIISVMAAVGGQTQGAAPTVWADVNGDGAVDVADIASVISIMAARARMQAATEE